MDIYIMYFTSMLFFLASEICIELSIHTKEALYSGINKHYHGTYLDLNILFSLVSLTSKAKGAKYPSTST
jgi:hypothetical protein